MKISVLLENSTSRQDLCAQHGLSLWICTKTHRILFDMGPGPAFLENARRMGIDPGQADLAILSHGHYDHADGIPAFLACNDHAPIYAHPLVTGSYWHGQDRYIGIDPAVKGCSRFIYTGCEYSLGEDMTLYSCEALAPQEPILSYGLTVKDERGFAPDLFPHEQYLLLREGGRRILISGCSHKGILNLMHWLHPDVVVGGFHFKSLQDMEEARRAARILRDSGACFYTGHCTGDEAFAAMKPILGDRLQALSTGDSFEL